MRISGVPDTGDLFIGLFLNLSQGTSRYLQRTRKRFLEQIFKANISGLNGTEIEALWSFLNFQYFTIYLGVHGLTKDGDPFHLATNVSLSINLLKGLSTRFLGVFFALVG